MARNRKKQRKYLKKGQFVGTIFGVIASKGKLSFLSFGLLLVCALTVVQVVFSLVQAQLGKSAEVALRGLVEDSNSISNPYYFSQMVAGLQRSRLLQCVSVRKLDQTIPFYRSGGLNCSNPSPPIFLQGAPSAAALKAANGEVWNVEFVGVNGEFFDLSLWLARVLAFVALSIAYAWNLSRIRHVQKVEALKSKAARDFEIFATQIAHDIRSPLSALEVLVKETTGLPEGDRQTLMGAASRIKEIATDLLERRIRPDRNLPNDGQKCFVPQVINSILLEKRAQFRNRKEIEFEFQVTPENNASYSTAPSEELKRVISNLMNNAVEAMISGRVVISVKPIDGFIEIRIRDEGPGIPDSVLSRLGERGVSLGRHGDAGSGLGLSHAYEFSNRLGGHLKIESTVGRGTEVILCMPAIASPSGPIEGNRTANATLLRAALIDNDLQIHALWKRVASKRNVELQCFSNPEDFFSIAESISKDTEIFLDWDLGKGIDPVSVGTRLNKIGFSKIFVCTGSPGLVSKEFGWIKQILGKDPPWL